MQRAISNGSSYSKNSEAREFMYEKSLLNALLLVAAVIFSYTLAGAQVPDKAKDAASKTKDPTVKTAN
jgi:hypothetical protein